MARPDNLRGTYVTILMGDGATPEVFTVLCGITTKSITDTVNTSDGFNRDCDEPEDVPVRTLILSGRQWSMRGAGQMNRANIKSLDDAVGKIKNYRFFIAAKTGETSATVPTPLNGYYGGAAAITSKVVSGDDGAYAGVDLTFESDGPWAWTDVALV